MNIDGRFWLLHSNKTFLGKGRIELLKFIDKYGSISKAAKEMKMSYKAAWDMVDAMDNLSPEPLVIRVSGGSGGGGARLTEYAKKLILVYEEIEKKYQSFLKQIAIDTYDLDQFIKTIGRISMKLSARNQISGKIIKLVQGPVNCELVIEIKGGDKLAAIITKDAADELGLKEGSEVRAIFKANSVLIAKGTKPKLSARNILEGKVLEIIKGSINSEVKIELKGGNKIVTLITNDASDELELKVGDSVFAIFKASAVIIGVE